MLLKLPSFISKVLSCFDPSFSVHTDFHGHQIKHIIYLLQHFSTSLFEWDAVLLVSSFDFCECIINIGLFYLCRHLLFIMQIDLQTFQSVQILFVVIVHFSGLSQFIKFMCKCVTFLSGSRRLAVMIRIWVGLLL